MAVKELRTSSRAFDKFLPLAIFHRPEPVLWCVLALLFIYVFGIFTPITPQGGAQLSSIHRPWDNPSTGRARSYSAPAAGPIFAEISIKPSWIGKILPLVY